MSVGGSEFGTSQLHIVYLQHVLYELLNSEPLWAERIENVGFFIRVSGRLRRLYRQWDLSACSDTGFRCFFL